MIITARENLSTELYEGRAEIDFTRDEINITLVEPDDNITDTDGILDFVFTSDTADIPCYLMIDNNISGTLTSIDGDNTYSDVTLENGTYEWFIRCNETGDITDSETRDLIISITEAVDSLEIGTCPTTTSGALIFIILLVVALFFIFIGLQYSIFGIFGSFLLMIMSWYIAGCIGLFAFIIAGVSFMSLIWFSLRGFSN